MLTCRKSRFPSCFFVTSLSIQNMNEENVLSHSILLLN